VDAAAAHEGAGIDALATPAQRLPAWVLDAVIGGLVFTPLNPILYSSRPSLLLFVALLVPTMLLLFGYLVLFDGGARGTTPGKRVIGIRAADATTGNAIGYRRAAVRRLVYLLGGLVFYIGCWSDPLSSVRLV